jgi:anhydro-N-acetylmuramic acid kinase
MHKNELYIGLISGTSIDAIDAALVDFSEPIPKLIATHSHAIPDKLRISLHDLCATNANDTKLVDAADIKLGNLFADAALTLSKKAKIKNTTIKAIGSHGQTILHQPNASPPFSLQIGDPRIIATKTKIATVANFRQKDIELGGQGAPLTPAFHNIIFRKDEIDRFVLNIGGITNITYLPAANNKPIIGFDAGPGNTLLDLWSRLQQQKHYDKDGQWAAHGKINQDLLDLYMQDDYFTLPYPKSTGRDYFNLAWLTTNFKKLNKTISPQNIQTTLTALTVTSIVHTIKQITSNNNYELLVCGGGVHNSYLMQQLQQAIKPNKLYPTDQKGFPADWIEAATFAWFATQNLAKQPTDLTNVTGAKKPTILGEVFYP